MEKYGSRRIIADKTHKIYSCLYGFTVFSLFFGEQIKIVGIPLYCILILVSFIAMIIEKHGTVHFSFKIKLNSIISFCLFWIIIASMMLPLSYKTCGISTYMYCVWTALIVLFVYICANTLEDVYWLCGCALLGIVMTCIISIIEIKTGAHFIRLNDYYLRMGLNNAFGFQININDNASLLTIGLFAILLFFKKTPKFCCLLFGATLYVIWRIDSRMCILAMAVAACEAFIIFVLGRIVAHNRQVTITVLCLLVLCTVTIVWVNFNAYTFLNLVSDSANRSSDLNRINYISTAFNTLSITQFIFGNGAGVTSAKLGYSIHSVLVEILCDYGFIVFAWLMTFIIRLQISFTNRGKQREKVFFSCFATAFVIVSFCSSSMLRIRPIWMIFALICRYHNLVYKKNKGMSTNTKKADLNS